MGTGRRTLGSDQENALAYADPNEDAEEVDRYFERIATDVNRGLERCGFPPDPNNVASSSALWRMSASDWEAFRAVAAAQKQLGIYVPLGI